MDLWRLNIFFAVSHCKNFQFYMSYNSAESAIERTDTDAAVSKLSCVEAGYYEDEFIAMFVKVKLRRNPIINMGYYIRVSLMRRLIYQFVLSMETNCQIVILGAGSDTNGLWALKEFGDGLKVFEVDFVGPISRKARCLSQNRHQLQCLFPDSEYPNCSFNNPGEVPWGTNTYRLLSYDLRDPMENLDSKLQVAGFQRNLPTLFLSECVLIYLTRPESDRVISWIANRESLAILGVYEPINGQDPFGKMMVENLSRRGTPLLSIVDSVEYQRERFTSLGFTESRVEKLADLTKLFPQKKLVIFDEVEEFNLFQNHYCFAMASSISDEKVKDMITTMFERNCDA